MGVDGISIMFVLISTALTPIAILSSWNSTGGRVREYMVAFLVMETMMVGLFSALDFILFFVFFEGVLIPMFIIIGVWGGERRLYAAIKFFLFMFAGSMLMLLGILALWFHDGTTSIPAMMHIPLATASAVLAVPRLPGRIRGEDPDLAGPHLAARRASRGADRGFRPARRRARQYGRLWLPSLSRCRCCPMPPSISRRSCSRSVWVAVIYTSIAALVQRDLLKLVAYSSVGHMAIAVIGIFTFNVPGH